MFEHGTPAQRECLIAQMTGHILELSLQMYGCRVVQKVLLTPQILGNGSLGISLSGHRLYYS